MKNFLVLLTVAGCLISGSAMAKSGMGIQWSYATGVAFNMKMDVHEFYVGTDLTSLMYGAVPIIAGYQYDIPITAIQALPLYVCVGGNVTILAAPVFAFSGGGIVGVGIEYAINEQMSFFADGGIAITYVPPITYMGYTLYAGGIGVGPSIKAGLRFVR